MATQGTGALNRPRYSGNQWASRAYGALLDQHGAQGWWWPAEGKFEVMVGAILTQNTAWANVEKAIANLKAANMLCVDAIVHAEQGFLAELIRPSGYFNVKAKRLRYFCEWYAGQGEYRKLRYWSTASLRLALLGVHGVGPETADDILLYAFNRPVFVIDAYTRRIFARLGRIRGDEPYDEIRAVFEQQLVSRPRVFAEFHALIVQHGKYVCQPEPKCRSCFLNTTCQSYKGQLRANVTHKNRDSACN